MPVEDGDRGMRKSGKFRSAEGKCVGLIDEGETSGSDGGSLVLHLLCGQNREWGEDEKREGGER